MHENRNLFLFLIEINTMHRNMHILRIPKTCIWAVGLKIEIHEIHQNLRNPMCIINKNPSSGHHLHEAKII